MNSNEPFINLSKQLDKSNIITEVNFNQIMTEIDKSKELFDNAYRPYQYNSNAYDPTLQRLKKFITDNIKSQIDYLKKRYNSFPFTLPL